MFDNILAAIEYVTNASFFYQSMGMTTATAIFIGASIYNGDVRTMWKGLISVGAYAGLVLLTTVPRVYETLSISTATHRPGLEYAGIVTIAFITIYYVLGILIGVYTVQRARSR